MIRMEFVRGKNKPMLACAHCGEIIRDLTDAVALFAIDRPYLNGIESKPCVHVHEVCVPGYDPSNRLWHAPLARHLRDALRRSGYSMRRTRKVTASPASAKKPQPAKLTTVIH